MPQFMYNANMSYQIHHMIATNFFWWIMSIVLFAPQLSIHLQANVVEVHVTSNVFHVALGDVVA